MSMTSSSGGIVYSIASLDAGRQLNFGRAVSSVLGVGQAVLGDQGMRGDQVADHHGENAGPLTVNDPEGGHALGVSVAQGLVELLMGLVAGQAAKIDLAFD